MYKQIFQIFLLFLAINQLSAQLPRRWYAGLSLQVQKYWLYNYNDFNNPWLTPVAPKALVPNAISGGLAIGRNFNPRFSFQTELQYSSQTQKFFYALPSVAPDIDINTKINYLKIPLIFQYNHLKWAKKTVGFYAEVGLQTSFCMYYQQEAQGINRGGRVYDLWEKKPFNRNWQVSASENTDNIFKKVALGTIAGLGLKKIINEEYLLQAGVRFDYDFTNANNLDAKWYLNGQTYSHYQSALHYNPWRIGDTLAARKNTHNIRAGFNFSISYFLNN